MPSGGRFEGKFYGFPIGGKCLINRDCKVAPIKRYLAEKAGSCRKVRKNIVQYIGIALDEPKRLERLGGNRISLLAKYDYAELHDKFIGVIEDYIKLEALHCKMLDAIKEGLTREWASPEEFEKWQNDKINELFGSEK